jgi:AraC-like DNA-binding protein
MTVSTMRRIAKEEYYRYFPVSDRQRLWDFYVTGVGRIVRAYRGTPDRGHPAPYYYVWESGRVLDQFGLIYITQGKGEFQSATTRRTVVDAGTLFLLLPGVWHRYRPCDRTCWSYYWVHLGGAYLTRLLQRQVISPERPIFKTGLRESLLRPYAALVERARTEPPGFQQMMCGNVLEILGAALASEHGQLESDQLGTLVRQATVMLEQGMQGSVDMRQLAASLGVSYDGFRHAFRRHTGLAPHHYLLQLRINHAKGLLYSTDLTVKEIAASLGFEDPYYFSRAFRKATGMSPNRWRQQSQVTPARRPDDDPPGDVAD